MMKANLYKIFALCLLFYSTIANAQPDLANSSEWLFLLHYDGRKSVVDPDSPFFLSTEGYRNPQAELTATIEAFAASATTICNFPARREFIENNTGLKFPSPDCPEYDEFLLKVPMDKVYIIFAAENNTAPNSVLGHIFLKFQGISENRLREHAFSYFAADIDTQSPKFYWDVLVGSSNGIYALTPYAPKRDRYLREEQRPIWELEINLTQNQKNYLQKHLWELKDQNVRYSFLFHNCGNGTSNLLNIVYPDVKTNPAKLLNTPMDYIKAFDNQGLITASSLIPSEEYQVKSSPSKPKNILDSKPSSRIYIGNNHFQKSTTVIDFMPLYQDFYDVSKTYFDDIETKIMSINARYDDKFYLNNIDIFSIRSISDSVWSKHLKISMTNALGDDGTNLRPQAELGGGYAFSLRDKTIKPYILPKIGYRHDRVNNFYFTPEIGIIFKPVDDIKIITTFEKYFDSRFNNRNFNEKFSANISYLLGEYTLYGTCSKYSGTGNNTDNELSFGIGRHF